MQIKIAQLDRDAKNDGVIICHWTASKTEGEYTASGYGADSFTPDPDSPNFIPFEQLTEADVVGWLINKDGWAEALEARLDADIERQKNPPILHGVPWSDEVKDAV